MLPVRGASQSLPAPLDLISLALQALWTGKAAVAAIGQVSEESCRCQPSKKITGESGYEIHKQSKRNLGVFGQSTGCIYYTHR